MNKAPFFMVTASGSVATLHYGSQTHNFGFSSAVGETSVERVGNAIRIYWKFARDGPWNSWQGAFEIAIDDIGLHGAGCWVVDDF